MAAKNRQRSEKIEKQAAKPSFVREGAQASINKREAAEARSLIVNRSAWHSFDQACSVASSALLADKSSNIAKPEAPLSRACGLKWSINVEKCVPAYAVIGKHAVVIRLPA